MPQGQFGTRLMGGKDAASARYIYTRLDPMARALFHEADDALLDYLNEEGQVIEPKWYVPLIPTVLVNGAGGIDTRLKLSTKISIGNMVGYFPFR